MNRSALTLLAAAVIGTLTTAGCYTLIKHPTAELPTDDSLAADEGCTGCHSYGTRVPAFSDPWYPPPWWWHDDDHSAGSVQDPEGRHLWDRGPGAPYVGGVGGNTGWAPAPAPPNPGVPAAVDTSRAQSGSTPAKDKEKDRGRHGWGR